MHRHTEDLAKEHLAAYARVLTKLAYADHPDTSDIEEARKIVPLIDHDLRVWASWRHLVDSHAVNVVAFRETHPEVAAQMDVLAVHQGLRQIAAASFDPIDAALATVRPA